MDRRYVVGEELASSNEPETIRDITGMTKDEQEDIANYIEDSLLIKEIREEMSSKRNEVI